MSAGSARKLARPWRLGRLTIRNRLVRSATAEGLSTSEGAPSPKLIKITRDLARGGAGLIIAGSAHISSEARADKYTTGMDHDRLIEPLKRWCDSVHREGGIMAAQLLHCGSTCSPEILHEKQRLSGPSSMVDPVHGYQVVELAKDEIRTIVDDYADAAGRAQTAGFDGVQIHGAHGYLTNQFLSPYRNQRKDSYGGRLENRARLLCQVFEAVRARVGPSFPLLVKLSVHDGFPGGVLPSEAVRVAETLDSLGIDAIEVSGGSPDGAKNGGWDHIRPAPFEQGSLLKYAEMIKEQVGCPVICVEGWRDPKMILKALETIDAVSMSRPFIREPGLANRWLSGDLTPARCISCNRCLDLTAASGLACIFHKKDDPNGRSGCERCEGKRTP